MKNSKIIGRIHSLESCGTVDGPGIRFVVFMQGCPLRCKYCHNPDTWEINKGKEYTPQELMAEIRKYKSYIKFSGGGVTFTGGEPLLQADFVAEVSKMCQEEGISVAIDTSGYVWNDAVERVLDYTDIVLLDIKNFNPDVYTEITGVPLAPTLHLMDYLKRKNINTWIRYVLVPNLTDNLHNIEELSNYLDQYPNVSKIELLGFHKMGEYKWEKLGLEYTLSNTREPDKVLLNHVKEILGKNGKSVSLNS